MKKEKQKKPTSKYQHKLAYRIRLANTIGAKAFHISAKGKRMPNPLVILKAL